MARLLTFAGMVVLTGAFVGCKAEKPAARSSTEQAKPVGVATGGKSG